MIYNGNISSSYGRSRFKKNKIFLKNVLYLYMYIIFEVMRFNKMKEARLPVRPPVDLVKPKIYIVHKSAV